MMISLLVTLPLLLGAEEADVEKMFSEVKLATPFDKYLLANQLLMEVSGAKVIQLANGHHVVLAVGSTSVKDNSAKDRIRREKVCRIKALASVVAEKKGVQIAHTEVLKEKTVIVIENGKEKAKSVSKYLELTKSKVEGIARDMPVVGRWKSKDGAIFYLAIGVLLDANGQPVRRVRR
jgi:hypothetical protein